MSVPQPVRHLEHSVAQRYAVDRSELYAEVSQRRTEAQGAPTAADRAILERRSVKSVAEEAQASLRAPAETALTASRQGSGDIASAEVWARSEEQAMQRVLDEAQRESARELSNAISFAGWEVCWGRGCGRDRKIGR